MYLKELEKIDPREIMPGFFGRMIHTDSMSFVYWDIKEGSLLPEHSHVHEQVVNMLEGKFLLVVEGESRELLPGSVVAIPGNAAHSGKALTDCRILDVFCPVREDYKL